MNYRAFFAEVKHRRIFGRKHLTARRKAGMRAIIEEADGRVSDRALAYILATAWWETGQRMEPVIETFATTPRQAAARLERAWRKGKLRWVKTPYWRPDSKGRYWIGRSFVQLTHKRNYSGKVRRAVRARFGVDILENPDLVLRMDIAAFIIVEGMRRGWFTGRKLGDNPDFYAARKVVNPGDRSSYRPIADAAERFQQALVVAKGDDFDQGTGTPARTVRQVQTRLRELGYSEVGTVDGIYGPRTEAAILAFRNDNGLPLTPEIDADLTKALAGAKPRREGVARREATASDLAKAGSTDIDRAANGMVTGTGLAGVGASLAMAGEVTQAGTGFLSGVKSVADFAKENIWIFLVITGCGIAWWAWRARKNRVEKHRTGEYVSR